MKLFLTSAGLLNDTTKKAFLELVGKPASEIKVAFIPTASNIEPGDKWWLIDDLKNLKEMKFAQLDIIDIAAVPQKVWQPRLEEADVLFFGGGNLFFLKYWINKSGLIKMLGNLLESRVWAGISAGNMVPGQNIICDEEKRAAEDILGESINTDGLNYTDISINPHFLSTAFDDRSEAVVAEEAKQAHGSMYAIDDETAIVVNGDNIKVVSEGKWKKFENA